jgi:hypothetical protein
MTRQSRCAHWGHHLLRQCSKAPEFDGLCGDHYLSCGVGCPPVRLIWWNAVSTDWWKIRIGAGQDDYGNTSRYVQLPMFGTLIVFGKLRPLSHDLQPDQPVEEGSGGKA